MLKFKAPAKTFIEVAKRSKLFWAFVTLVVVGSFMVFWSR
jgi:hypothetical protein